MASAQILTNGKALYAYNGTEWVPLNTAGNLVNSTRWQFTAVGSETSLSGNDDYGDSLIYTPGYEQVYLNGVLLARDADYTATNGTTITGLTALTAGYIVEVIAYNNINVGNTYTQNQIDTKIADTFERWTKTVSASGTVISGLDDSSVTLDYTAGLEKVYINGILLAPEEYVATSGSAVILDEAVEINDIIQIHTLKNFRVANHYTINQTDGLLSGYLSQSSASSTYLTQASGLTAATASATYAPLAAGGLVLISTDTFTGASSKSFSNVFSSTYTNYRVILDVQPSTSATVSLRFRTTSDDTGSVYSFQNLKATSTTVAGTRTLSATSIDINGGAGNKYIYTWDIAEPNTTEDTVVFSTANEYMLSWYATYYVDTTTQYTGFSIFPSTGTITGKASIYGYKK